MSLVLWLQNKPFITSNSYLNEHYFAFLYKLPVLQPSTYLLRIYEMYGYFFSHPNVNI